MTASRARALMLACIGVGAALRIARLLEHPFLHADAPALLTIARDVLGGDGFARALAGYYPPLYPAAIRLVHSVTGLDWESAGRIVSCVAGIATVGATGVLGTILAGETVGLTAALVCAVHPGLVHSSAEVLAESLHGMFVVGWGLLVLPSTPARPLRLAVSGALAAASSLVRAEGVALVPLTLVAAMAGAAPGTRWRAVLIPSLTAGLVLLPVLATVHGITGTLALSGKEAPAILRRYGVPAGSLAALVWGHPAAWLRVYPRALGRQITLSAGTIHGVLLIPTILGLAGPPRTARRARTVVLLVLACLVLGIPMIAPGKRYVVPLLPLLIPFAALGLGTLARAGAARRIPRWAIGGVGATVAIGLVAQALWPPSRTEETCIREICARAHAAMGASLPPVLVDDSRVAWTCGAPLVLRPEALHGNQLIAFARQHHAGFIVVRPDDVPTPDTGTTLAVVCAGTDDARAVLAVR